MMYGTDGTRGTTGGVRRGTGLALLGCALLGFCSCRSGPIGSLADVPTASIPAVADTAADTPVSAGEAPPAAVPGSDTWSLSDTAERNLVQPASAVLPYEVPTPAVPTVASRPRGRAVHQPPLRPAPCQPCIPNQPAMECLPTSDCGSGCCNLSPWVPPGLAPPWPQDEYLFDGGDAIPDVRVKRDWSVQGLDLEDTVIHYDTLDGQTRVQPSNRVCLYAPRFASVRKVSGVFQHEGHLRSAGVELPTPVQGMGDVQIATTAIQPLQPGLDRGTMSPGQFFERQPPIGLENHEGLTIVQAALLPYEDFRIIRDGLMDNSEKARLAQHAEAAVAWTHDKAVQVVIDNIAAKEDVGIDVAAGVHLYELHGKPRVRICKLASRCDALPGEIVEFTIRFDNVGDQVIGNVTIIDNLTTRLEYVEQTQSCSLGANFSSSENQGDSLTLRWEITDPIPVSQGGVIRFQCRVR